jgi:hypothetical protein
MSSGVSLAFALIRVPRGQPRPSEDDFRKALAADRKQLRQPAPNGAMEFTIAGPYPVVVDGADLDEWVVWER